MIVLWFVWLVAEVDRLFVEERLFSWFAFETAVRLERKFWLIFDCFAGFFC